MNTETLEERVRGSIEFLIDSQLVGSIQDITYSGYHGANALSFYLSEVYHLNVLAGDNSNRLFEELVAEYS